MNAPDQMAQLYQHLWEAHGDGEFGNLDLSLQLRPPSMLYDLLRENGIGRENTILDIGCGKGYQSSELAHRFNCQVIGIDLAPNNLRFAYAQAMTRNLSDLVSFRSGNIESIPLNDESVDLVWCHDMLVHVENLESGLKECFRVLRTGGTMIILATVGTELLCENEVVQLFTSLKIMPPNIDRQTLVETINMTGFQLVSEENIGGERLEYQEELNGQYSKEFRRLMRLVRNPDHYSATLEKDQIDIAKALYYWSVYLLIGKLMDIVFVLRK